MIRIGLAIAVGLTLGYWAGYQTQRPYLVSVYNQTTNQCTDDMKVWWSVGPDGMCHLADKPVQR